MPLPPPPTKKGSRLNLEQLGIQDVNLAFTPPAAAQTSVTKAAVKPGSAALAKTPDAVDTSVASTKKAPVATHVTGKSAATPTKTRKPSKTLDRPVAQAEVLPPVLPVATSQPNTPKRPTQPAKAPKRNTVSGPAKLFVLDTNVLLHDPMSLFRFEEHDVYLPMVVLEELDGHKKGMTEVARNGRQASRTLDALAAQAGEDNIGAGLPLNATGHTEARGRLFFQTEPLDNTLPTSLPQGKADNQILGVVQALSHRHTERVVAMVSKDINMRIKARALGLDAQDYENDKTLDDGELLYSGALALPTDFWTRQSKTVESWQQGQFTFYRVGGDVTQQFHINQFVYFEAPGEPPLYARVVEIRGKTAVLKTLRDFTHLKHSVWGVAARNREQNFALNLLMDPEIDFVTLTGTAGTGKTLMALAAGLVQVLDERRYTEIIMTRATVSVGEDIGFLPGTEEEKMGPWMGALDDNLEFLAKGDGGNAGEWGRAATNELIRSRIKVKSLNFMRGRTFMSKYVIIDEAQNLTPKQMKTLITRAGPGTKIVCMGNLAQIDTPYLTEGSSGMTYAVDRFKGWPHGGHITLARGERSRLADFASDVL